MKWINKLLSNKPKKLRFGKGIKKLLSKMAKPEKFSIGKEVNDLLSKMRSIPDDAMVKEVFLWELVRNADFALTLVRFESLVDKTKYGDPPLLFIHIIPDEKNNTLSVYDSGIGMTKDDLVSKLGTIKWVAYLAKYMKTIDKYSTHAADADADADLYSEDCSLGFYSTYMVADKVVVTTKKRGHDPYVWEFNANENGGSTFSVVAARGGDTFDRGTKVTLHLKKDYHEYLKVHKLQELVNKFPMVMCFYPIFILDENKTPIGVELKVKEEEEPLEVLKERYKGIRDLFVEHIRGKTNVDVVITERVAEVFCNLSVVDDGMSKLEINPRHPGMEDFRKMVESGDINDEEFSKALKTEILVHFELCLLSISNYDRIYGTSFYEKTMKALSLGDEYKWRCKNI